MRSRRAPSGTRARWALLVLALMLASSAIAAAPKFPPLTGRVVDDANILDASTQSQLTEMLAAHERATGEQVVVVTLESLQGYSIEDYGYQLGRHWGIGQKGKNTGAMLIVVPKERKVRIEVGYGLEGTLTDAISRTIIERNIVPYFRAGDFNAGVRSGVISMLRVLGGNPEMAEPAATSEAAPRVGQPRAQYQAAPIVLSALLGMSLLYMIPFLILGALMMMAPSRRSGWSSDGWSGRGSSGGSSSGGGSSGGGGFSGGGGSFGGGGASGSW
jgi:uncharacterized protein